LPAQTSFWVDEKNQTYGPWVWVEDGDVWIGEDMLYQKKKRVGNEGEEQHEGRKVEEA